MSAPLCPRCGDCERAPRRSGGYRSWCRGCEVEQKAQYAQSEAGRATSLRWYHKKHPAAPRQCCWCSSAFEPPRTRGHGHAKYCSADCAKNNQRHERNLRRVAARQAA